jgi:hypothetical protein
MFLPIFASTAMFAAQGPNYDELGSRICPLNDVDGDHCADFALDDGHGRAWVISGNTGLILAHIEGDAMNVGRYIAPLFGDADGDGVWDLVDWHSDKEILLRSGKDLHIVRRLPAPRGQDGFISVPVPAGDWNKDGVPDVAAVVVHDQIASMVILSGRDGGVLQTIGVGSQWSKRAYLHRHRLVIHSSCRAGDMRPASFVLPSGGPTGLVLIRRDATDAPIDLPDCDQSLWINGGTGFVGDVDGDGYPDLVISTYAEASRTRVPLVHKRGTEEVHSRDYVHRTVLISGLTGADLELLPDSTRGSIEGVAARHIADLDSDGVDEILLGDSGWPSGEVFILSGKDRHVLWSLSEDPECCAGSCRFGANVEALGDVDGDGVADFAITSSSGADALDPGCVAVYSGKSRRRLRSIWRADLLAMHSATRERESKK